MENKKRRKVDISITPLRLAVTIGGLALIGLNEFYMWDIPGLGFLFQKSEKTTNKTDLMIFITPHIVTPEVAADY